MTVDPLDEHLNALTDAEWVRLATLRAGIEAARIRRDEALRFAAAVIDAPAEAGPDLIPAAQAVLDATMAFGEADDDLDAAAMARGDAEDGLIAAAAGDVIDELDGGDDPTAWPVVGGGRMVRAVRFAIAADLAAYRADSVAYWAILAAVERHGRAGLTADLIAGADDPELTNLAIDAVAAVERAIEANEVTLAADEAAAAAYNTALEAAKKNRPALAADEAAAAAAETAEAAQAEEVLSEAEKFRASAEMAAIGAVKAAVHRRAEIEAGP